MTWGKRVVAIAAVKRASKVDQPFNDRDRRVQNFVAGTFQDSRAQTFTKASPLGKRV
jgi:hypothetical protein